MNSSQSKKYLDRCGYLAYSKDGCLFKVIKYIDSQNVTIKFQDEWGYTTKTSWQKVKNGSIKNPYKPNKYGGIMGTNIDINEDESFSISYSKEYKFWFNILCRCKDDKFKKDNHTYTECLIDEKWLYFWEFYKWLHNQDNFLSWNYNDGWAIDKDIIVKGNKIYSSETCCLVPKNINNLLLKHDKKRGEYPIGVTKRKSDGMFEVQCSNPLINKYVTVGLYSNEINAFMGYKKYKENIIKKVAELEYNKKNITKQCYNALLDYQVEIDD